MENQTELEVTTGDDQGKNGMTSGILFCLQLDESRVARQTLHGPSIQKRKSAAVQGKQLCIFTT